MLLLVGVLRFSVSVTSNLSDPVTVIRFSVSTTCRRFSFTRMYLWLSFMYATLHLVTCQVRVTETIQVIVLLCPLSVERYLIPFACRFFSVSVS